MKTYLITFSTADNVFAVRVQQEGRQEYRIALDDRSLAIAVLADWFKDRAPDALLLATEHEADFRRAFLDNRVKPFEICESDIIRWHGARSGGA